ncbi:MAG: sigma-70 family RNA polymerase sigma factor [Clostridia bacterium]|nr:sigma-70 family RNA polymerase sigma factor [Clostridia bacterium]
MSENELVLKAKNGDISAFETLYDKYSGKVYGYALRMTENTEDALDLAQEVFIRVYKSLAFFKGDSSFSTWLYSIASNVCIDFNRSKNRKKTAPLDEALSIPDLKTPENEFEKKEFTQAIADAISSLPFDMREVIVLREINGLSYIEIADALDLEVGTVKSRISRGREKLCSILKDYGNKKKSFPSKDVKGGQK